ncbi:MAG TPA: cytidine deaminase [Bdellovibrionota bacterium]|jgi:cytidine deaminase|nr:cytidine deaminase [Bdellovibrionota bacterium]
MASPQDLHSAACQAQENSYSPYSHARVGAALLTGDGRVFTGANIENSSYGATVCAERTAVVSAAAQGVREIREIVVVTDADPPWPPCGICRQVLMEFAGDPKQLKVHLADRKGIRSSHTLAELLPMAFSPSHLSGKARR